MSRKHLFAVVVLLGAAAVAGLLALTRTSELGAATQVSSTQIAAKERSLDRLEASLRRSLAEQPPALPSAGQAAAPSASTRTVYVRPSATSAQGAAAEHEDDDSDDEYEHENEHGEDDGYEGRDD
jgi:hypothetical protein